MTLSTVRADSAHVTPAPCKPKAEFSLLEFQINGTRPFHTHRDSAESRLSEAHALLTVMADRHDMAEDHRKLEGESDIRHSIQAEALRGIATLVALSLHNSDCVPAPNFSGSAA